MNQAQFDQAVQRYNQGDRDSARQICLNILERDPNHVSALQLLSIIAADRGNLRPAIALLRRAIAVAPEIAEQHKNLGLLLDRAGLPGQAIAAFQEAIQRAPELVDAYLGLGSALIEMGHVDEGIQAYQQVLRRQPDNQTVYLNLGFVLGKRGQLLEAIEHYQKVLAIAPGHPLALARLGEAHNLLGDVAQAKANYAQAIAAGAGDSVKILSKMVLPPIYDSLEHLQQTRRELIDGLDALERSELSIHDPVAEQAGIPFLLVYQGFNDRDVQRKIARLYRRAWQIEQPVLETDTTQPDKIRVGFISSFFRDHTVGKITRGLVAKLDRERFDVSVISIGHHRDEVAQSIKQHADDYTPVRPVLKNVARVVRAKKLDALVYMEVGMEHITYFLAFLRLAPIQCVMWGHPQTTGVDTIDYYLSCRDFEPEMAQSHYTEKLVCLDTIPVYYDRPPPPDQSQTRADFDLTNEQHVYYCPQTLFKMHPAFDEAIGAILRRDPQGRLLIPQAKRERWNTALQARFHRELADVADRIYLIPRLARSGFRNLVAASDVVLDTYPFGGGTTSLEAFVAGTPIVTRRTDLMRGRFTSAYYKKMQIPDVVADSADEYADLAIRIATDQDFRESVRERILERNHVLYEDAEAVRQFEAFLESAVREKR